MTKDGNVAFEKEELEKQKLIAEIDDLKARQETTGKNKTRESIQTWTTILVSVTTLIIGAATIGGNLNGFIKQKKQHQKLIVDQQISNLVQDLISDNDQKREYAIVLLTASETNVMPILLKYLEWTEDPDRIIYVLKSL